MRKKTKTDQLMLTSPVSVGRIVAGKYLAMAAVYTIVIALFALSPLVLSIYGKVALSEAYVALFGYWLYGLSCIAVGLFISSISESVIISAILTFYGIIPLIHDAVHHRAHLVKWESAHKGA